MQQLADTLQALFTKLLEIFDLLDFSFLISGGVALIGVLYGLGVFGVPLDFSHPDSMDVALGTLAAYVGGLVCFGAGRALRTRVAGPWGHRSGGPSMADAIRANATVHGLSEIPSLRRYFVAHDEELPSKDLGRANDADMRAYGLYPRLWSSVRQAPEAAESFKLLRSFWVRAAIYDGLSIALLIWTFVLIAGRLMADPTPTMGRLLGSCAVILAVGLGSTWICLREAARTHQAQVTDLIATVAWVREIRVEARIPDGSAQLAGASRLALASAADDLAASFAHQLATQSVGDLEGASRAPAFEALYSVAYDRLRRAALDEIKGAAEASSGALAQASGPAFDAILCAARGAVRTRLEAELVAIEGGEAVRSALEAAKEEPRKS